ncbi:MAG: hypothetical protein ABEJ82_10400 [Haloplanus sp.]
MSRDFELSRRKLLGSLGVVGAAAAGTRMTSAELTDVEGFDNNDIVVGDMDLRVGWTEHYAQFSAETTENMDVPADVRPYDPKKHDETNDGEGGVPDDFVPFPQFSEDPVVVVNDTKKSNAVDRFMHNTVVETTSMRPMTPCEDLSDAAPERKVVDLQNVKPGDFGEITFDFALCTNPGYVWLNGGLRSAFDNGQTKAEREAPAEDDPGGQTVELLEEMRAAVWYDDGTGDATAGDNVHQDGEKKLFEGGFTELLDLLSGNEGRGIPLDGDRSTEYDELDDDEADPNRDCFAGTVAEAESPVHSIGVTWWVPLKDGNQNELQTDAVEFELGFYAEQCRHNGGGGQSGDGAPDPSSVPAISFLAFGFDVGSDKGNNREQYDFEVLESDGDGPTRVKWWAPTSPDVVVAKGGQRWITIEKEGGLGTTGTVSMDDTEHEGRGPDQCPPSPLPDGYSGVKWEWTDGGFDWVGAVKESCRDTGAW